MMMIIFFGYKARHAGVLVPQPGIEPVSLALEAQSLPLMNSLHLPRKVPEFSHASAVGTHHYVRAPWVLPCPFTLFSPNPLSSFTSSLLPASSHSDHPASPLKPWFYG